MSVHLDLRSILALKKKKKTGLGVQLSGKELA
jgi:hypothetical protein